jgi:hypothetical protein
VHLQQPNVSKLPEELAIVLVRTVIRRAQMEVASMSTNATPASVVLVAEVPNVSTRKDPSLVLVQAERPAMLTVAFASLKG